MLCFPLGREPLSLTYLSLGPFTLLLPEAGPGPQEVGGGLEKKPGLSTFWQPRCRPARAQRVGEEDAVTYLSVAPSFSKRPMEGAARRPGG